MRLCSTSSRAAFLNAGSGISRQQRDRIVIQLAPAHRIEIAKQAAGVVVPAPPQVARQRPQPFLRGSDKAVQRARLADHRRDLGRGLYQHANFIVPKVARLRRSAPPARPAARRGRSRERPETIDTMFFARFLEVLEARDGSALLRPRPAAPAPPPGRPGLREQPCEGCRYTAGRRPTVAASTRLARSGSSRYAEHTSVSKRLAIRATTFISVSAGLPPSAASWPSSSRVKT